MTNYKNYEIVEKNNRYQTRLKEKIWKINDKTPKTKTTTKSAQQLIIAEEQGDIQVQCNQISLYILPNPYTSQ